MGLADPLGCGPLPGNPLRLLVAPSLHEITLPETDRCGPPSGSASLNPRSRARFRTRKIGFDRLPRGVRISASGKSFLEDARRIRQGGTSDGARATRSTRPIGDRQDHRFIKKRITASPGFRSAEGASRAIEGYDCTWTRSGQQARNRPVRLRFVNFDLACS